MHKCETTRIRHYRRLGEKSAILLATVAIFVLFLVLMCPCLWSHSTVTGPLGTVEYKEAGWLLESEDGSFSMQVKGRECLKLQAGQVYRMHTALTYDGAGDKAPCLFLETEHRYCRVFLDDQLLFRYMPQDEHKWDRSRSPGYIYKAITLPEHFQGKELTVEFTPALRLPMGYELPEVHFGDYGSTVKSIVSRDLPHNIVAVLCAMLGFSALIFSAASFTGSDYREGFNIGTFSLLAALYFLADCRTNYYYIGNPYYFYIMNLTTFSLMPVSFMGVMREFLEGVRRRICTLVIVLEMTFFAAELALHLTGVLDMRELLPAIHLLGFGEVILVSCLFLSIPCRRRKISLLLQMLPIAAGMVIDSVIYWKRMDTIFNDTTFTTIGLVIFLFKQLISKVVTQATRLSDMQQHTIQGMATLIESRDGSTGAHVRNTGVYARMLSEELFRQGKYPREIDSEFISRIGWMAQLHDVGKIKISDTILNKPGKFTPEEYEIMKTHAALGGDIIRQIMSRDMEPDALQMAVNIATYHHERWDGTGYPEGRKGTEIPLCARIMAVADVFDAMSSKRVYKEKMEMDQVFAELEANENTQFQKEMVEAALSIRPQLEDYVAKNQSSCPAPAL